MSTTEDVIAANVNAAWERHAGTVPISVRYGHTERAFKAGFVAGLEFARLAAELEVADV